MTWPWAVTHQQLRSGQLRSREVHAGPLGRDRKGSIGKPRGTETFCPKLTGAAHRTSCFAATSHFPSAAAPRGALAGALSPGRSGGPGGRALATGQQQGCGQGLCAQLPPVFFLDPLLGFPKMWPRLIEKVRTTLGDFMRLFHDYVRTCYSKSIFFLLTCWNFFF